MKENQSTIDQIIENIEKAAPPMVTRLEIQKLTGGVVLAKTLANIDSQNQSEGIPNRVRYGRRIAYPTPSFISWLRQRLEVVPTGEQEVV